MQGHNLATETLEDNFSPSLIKDLEYINETICPIQVKIQIDNIISTKEDSILKPRAYCQKETLVYSRII